MSGRCGLKHSAAGPSTHRRRRAAAWGMDRPGSCLHLFLYVQATRAKGAESLVCVLQQILRDGDVHQSRMNVAVPKVSRQERQFVLRVDPGSIPLENAVHYHRVAQIVNAWTSLAFRRLDA